MHLNRQTFITVFMWGLLMVGALQIQHHDLQLETDGCGPWGCGPTMEVLITCHLFWLSFLSYPALLLFQTRSRQFLYRLGFLLIILSLSSITIVAVYEYFNWYREASAWHQSFFRQRIIFCIATLVELPMLETGLYGVVLMVSAYFKKPTLSLQSTEDFASQVPSPI